MMVKGYDTTLTPKHSTKYAFLLASCSCFSRANGCHDECLNLKKIEHFFVCVGVKARNSSSISAPISTVSVLMGCRAVDK